MEGFFCWWFLVVGVLSFFLFFFPRLSLNRKKCISEGEESKTCSLLSEWLILQSCSAKHVFGFPSGFVIASPLWFNSLNFFGVMLLNTMGCFFLQYRKNSTSLTRCMWNSIYLISWFWTERLQIYKASTNPPGLQQFFQDLSFILLPWTVIKPKLTN